jgi:hypothetical protein
MFGVSMSILNATKSEGSESVFKMLKGWFALVKSVSIGMLKYWQ